MNYVTLRLRHDLCIDNARYPAGSAIRIDKYLESALVSVGHAVPSAIDSRAPLIKESTISEAKSLRFIQSNELRQTDNGRSARPTHALSRAAFKKLGQLQARLNNLAIQLQSK
jgi:hypothetical protein